MKIKSIDDSKIAQLVGATLIIASMIGMVYGNWGLQL